MQQRIILKIQLIMQVQLYANKHPITLLLFSKLAKIFAASVTAIRIRLIIKALITLIALEYIYMIIIRGITCIYLKVNQFLQSKIAYGVS